jgi:hypothetical protein
MAIHEESVQFILFFSSPKEASNETKEEKAMLDHSAKTT